MCNSAVSNILRFLRAVDGREYSFGDASKLFEKKSLPYIKPLIKLLILLIDLAVSLSEEECFLWSSNTN